MEMMDNDNYFQFEDERTDSLDLNSIVNPRAGNNGQGDGRHYKQFNINVESIISSNQTQSEKALPKCMDSSP
jgi:hypothetical protein